jgi:mRNA interferase MazF
MSRGQPEVQPRRGEIWLVLLPNQPDDIHTPRPAIVVSIDARNRLASDVIVVPMSTNLRPLSTHVLLVAGTGGLRRDSMALCEQVATLNKRLLVDGPLGERIPEAVLRQVVLGIGRAIGELLGETGYALN